MTIQGRERKLGKQKMEGEKKEERRDGKKGKKEEKCKEKNR